MKNRDLIPLFVVLSALSGPLFLSPARGESAGGPPAGPVEFAFPRGASPAPLSPEEALAPEEVLSLPETEGASVRAAPSPGTFQGAASASLTPATLLGAPVTAEEGAPEGAFAEDDLLNRQSAYEKSLAELLPVSPDELRSFRVQADARQKALADSPPQALRTRSVAFNLEPGFRPPVVELTPNLVTALVFLDKSGAPWPITSSILGSGALFSASVIEDGEKNRVVLSPLASQGNSNLVVTLAGAEIPLIIRLETRSGVDAQRQVDGLIIYQIQGNGPRAAPEILEPRASIPVSDLLYGFLDGVIPVGAVSLTASPRVEETAFYLHQGKLYARTRHSLMWPGFAAKVSGAGGYAVYESDYVPSVLLAVGEDVRRINLAPSDDRG
ncbi:MAG: DotH/IcmK family type IV secretion protein [Deltaproteobacteria bacterium]|jgi:intracellular multiplication protein IcmK|nr:DotH/IcmK family type IV secretion protein [Deltaproteobacteria bacterium]